MPTIFFFSSRRRHTRFKCDWSSDVCSSDLNADSGKKEVNNTKNPEASERSSNRNGDIPPERRLLLGNASDQVGDPRHRTIVQHHRWPWHSFLKRNCCRSVSVSH